MPLGMPMGRSPEIHGETGGRRSRRRGYPCPSVASPLHLSLINALAQWHTDWHARNEELDVITACQLFYVGLIKEAKRKHAILSILWIYLVNEKRELASG
jgi:nitroreductase